jgi:hypothetical protein
MLDLNLKKKQGLMTSILDTVIVHTLKEVLNVVSMIFLKINKLKPELNLK